MAARRQVLVLAVASAALLGCEERPRAWRDQYVFVGDRGMVVPLVVRRDGSGNGEVKGWLGRDGAWRAVFYDRFGLAARDAPDVRESLEAWSRGPGVAARASLAHDGDAVGLRVRTRTTAMRIRADRMRELGTHEDLEGRSVYRAGRAALTTELDHREGWLVAERTPPDRPRDPFVDYGDFVFLVGTDGAGRLVVLKHSRTRVGFRVAFVARDGRARATRAVHVEDAGAGLRLRLPALGLERRLEPADRSSSRGTAPSGDAVAYETLLFDAPHPGVAFRIRPARERVR